MLNLLLALLLVAKFDPQTIINLEKGALDRWGKGDPDGYFEIMSPDVTYFDPMTERRIDGRDTLKKMIEPFRGKIHIDRVELLNPVVDHHGDIAILSFNLVSHVGPRDVRWNVTEVYRSIGGQWKIVHSHFSYTKPPTS